MKSRIWIALDWGTSNLRAFAVDYKGSVMDEKTSDQGMIRLKPHEFEPALINLVGPWLKADESTEVFACGMVGSRQGWCEAAYRQVPCIPVAAGGLKSVPVKDPRITVHILPGLCQREPADVMRGEETQIAGLLAHDPSYLGAVCLPGTHSKWASVEAGNVTGFTTFMTGELFEILSEHSVLKHSVSSGEWDSDAFVEAALSAAEAPETAAAGLFSLRAQSLLENLAPPSARAKLSGMLIGQEIAMARAYWSSGTVTLIGSSGITQLYSQALHAIGRPVQIADTRKVTLAGLQLATSAKGAQDA